MFARQLSDPENVDGLQYLRRRGLTDETIERFALGYAPESWDRLATALERGGFDTMRAAADVGLIGQRREGRGHYDKFRHRVIFPLREPLRGQVIAFAGRTLRQKKTFVIPERRSS